MKYALYAAAVVIVAAVGVGAGHLLMGRDGGEAGPQPPLDGEMAGFELLEPAPAPATRFAGADGAELTLQGDFVGRLILVNFWATWCAPCVEEMPSLDRLQAALGGEDFEVVAISIDRGGVAAVEPFFQRHGLEHLATYVDPLGSAPRGFEILGLPTTVLIDPGGRWVGRLAGPAEWDSDEAKALIRHFVEAAGEAPA